MTTLVHVPQRLLLQVLEATRGFLLQMLETNPGWMTEEQAVHMLRSNLFQLHVAIDEKNNVLAAMVTEIVEAPSGQKVCLIVGIAGVNRDKWMEHLGGMEQWALAEGCARLRIKNARKGWLREERLKPYRASFEFERTLP
jgi:hypothetical protein